MKYRVESIGAAFTPKEMTALSKLLDTRSDEGWELHTVFAVQQKGCMGANEGQTYLAVYRKE